MKLPVVSLATLPEPPPEVDPAEWWTLAYAEQLKLQGLKVSLNPEPAPRGLTQGFLKFHGSTIRVELDPEPLLLRGYWGHALVELDSSQLVSIISLVRRKLLRLHANPPKNEEAYLRQADFLAKLLEALHEGGASGKLTH